MMNQDRPESMEDSARQGCNIALFLAGAFAASGDVFLKRLGTAGERYYGTPQVMFGIVVMPWLFIAFGSPKEKPLQYQGAENRASHNRQAQWQQPYNPRPPPYAGKPAVQKTPPQVKTPDNPAGLFLYWLATLGWLIVQRIAGAAKRAKGYETHSLHIGLSLFPGNRPWMLEVIAMGIASVPVGMLTDSALVMTYMWFVAGGMMIRNGWLEQGRKARVRRMKDAAWDARMMQQDLREAGGW